MAVVARETQLGHPRDGQSRNMSGPRNNQQYITQVSEKIEGRINKKLSRELGRTESRILGALSNLDGFLVSPQLLTRFGIVPGTIPEHKRGKTGTK